MKKLACILLILSAFLVFSCASSGGTPAATTQPAAEPSEPAAQPAAPAPAAESPSTPPLPANQSASSIVLDGARTHRVVWGNSLSKIALQYYGRRNGYYYPLIILGNPGVIKNPDLIVSGSRLKIPDLQRNLNNKAARAELKTYMNELAAYYAQRGGRINRTMSNNLRSLANAL
ncbi:MAG: LysM peptidoglycan-binding domain-containing protein [Treponema sp.]|jgi:Tfp pilus assembly protein FimV|nr:LysM peptidoglycan-binding domain-containing protein [Treponema sp.]